MSPERFNRRQRARETFFDAPALDMRQGFEDAIEVATQVKITDDIREALFSTANGGEFASEKDIDEGLAAAFRAAGFEVVE